MAYSLKSERHDTRRLKMINDATECTDPNGYVLPTLPTIELARAERYAIYSGINYLNHRTTKSREKAEEESVKVHKYVEPAYPGNPMINALTVKIREVGGGYELRLVMKWQPGSTDDFLAQVGKRHGWRKEEYMARIPDDQERPTEATPATMEERADRALARVGLGDPNVLRHDPDYKPHTPTPVYNNPEDAERAVVERTCKHPTQQELIQREVDRMAKQETRAIPPRYDPQKDYDPEDRTIRNAFAHVPSSGKSENGGND